jgi:hypothetical protein
LDAASDSRDTPAVFLQRLALAGPPKAEEDDHETDHRRTGEVAHSMNAVAQLVLYAVLIIVTMAILEWRERRRSRSSRERLHTLRQVRILERPTAREKRTA